MPQITTLKLSEVKEKNPSFRVDADFFHPEYLSSQRLIKKHEYKYFETFIKVVTGGATPLGANYPKKGVPFLRVQNIMQNYTDLSDVVYIDSKDDNILSRSKLKLFDVLLTITGGFGKSAVVTQDIVGANINQHSVRIELQNLNPFYVSTFLNSKYGYLQSLKNIVGVTRPALDYQAIKNFLIPLFSEDFQKEIENLVVKAHKLREESQNLYKEAEDILLEEIGFKGWSPKKKGLNIMIKCKSEVDEAKRIDAEYYQSQYEEIIEKIKEYKGGCSKLGKVAEILGNNSLKYEKKGQGVLKTKQIQKRSISYKFEGYVKQSSVTIQNKDILFASMGVGSLGKSCIHYNFNYDNLATIDSTLKIFRITSQEVTPEFIYILINTKLIQKLIYKYIVGSSGIINIYDKYLTSLPIPKVDKAIQKEIADKVEKSFQLQRESKELLELSKRAVEQAIETNEEQGFKLLKNKS